MNMNFLKLRKKYPEFIYESYSYELRGKDLQLNFEYKIKPDLKFDHKIIVKNVGEKKFDSFNKKVLNNLVFNIGMVEIPSYWKTTCSPVIDVKTGVLDDWQGNWWKKLVMNGMMQYFYTNKIDFIKKNFLTVSTTHGHASEKALAEVNTNKVLIPVGGGKDSIVSLESIAEEYNTDIFVVKPTTPASERIVNLNGSKACIVERVFDKKLFELNEAGYLNGHTPITSVMYFLSVLVASIYGHKYIAFSNERSSSEANIFYLGKELNHQYSKTLEFERSFSEYNKNYLSNIKLFSFLKPLYEIQISKLFASHEKYFSTIRSCNVGQQRDLWCGKCSKCLSTFILLTPFLGRKITIQLVGTDMYSDRTIESLLFDLIDPLKVKPFQCVGTRLELQVALNMAIKKNPKINLPVLLERFRSSKFYDQHYLDSKEIEIMSSFGKNNMPEKFEDILKNAYGK